MCVGRRSDCLERVEVSGEINAKAQVEVGKEYLEVLWAIICDMGEPGFNEGGRAW